MSDLNSNLRNDNILSDLLNYEKVEFGTIDKEFKDDNKCVNINKGIASDAEVNTKIRNPCTNELVNGFSEDLHKSRVSDGEITERGSMNYKVDHTESWNVSIDLNDPDNFVDILGNRQLTKRVLKKGLGRESRPIHGDYVTVSYSGWTSSGKQFVERLESLIIGDADVIQAFDLALCLAEKKEEFELITDAKFAYGVQGLLPHVHSNETLKYRIKLLEVEDAPDYTNFSYNDRVNAANGKRERGNLLYRREEFPFAVNSYFRAIKIIESEPDFSKCFRDPSKAELFDIFVKVTNNLAATQLKLEHHDNVVETCDSILSYEPENVKALFRKGKALSMKYCFDEALTNLRRAFELDSNNKLIQYEIQQCMKRKQEQNDRNERIYLKKFRNGAESSKTENSQPKSNLYNGWKTTFSRYGPYVGAALITVLSIFLASVAISKSRTN